MSRDADSYIDHQLRVRGSWARANQRALREDPSSAEPLSLYCKSCKVEKPHEFQEHDTGDIYNPPLPKGFICLGEGCTDFIHFEDLYFD